MRHDAGTGEVIKKNKKKRDKSETGKVYIHREMHVPAPRMWQGRVRKRGFTNVHKKSMRPRNASFLHTFRYERETDRNNVIIEERVKTQLPCCKKSVQKYDTRY